MEETKTFFLSLTENTLSRNKHFEMFANQVGKQAHLRYKMVLSLKRDVQRQADSHGAACWVSQTVGCLVFHLHNPAVGYKRTAILQDYEWDWLSRQQGVRALIHSPRLEAFRRDL